MSNDVSEFGKEMGLIQEAVVTGRKVGAGREFWSRLAHDSYFFAQLVAVAAHKSTFNHNKHVIDADEPDKEFLERNGYQVKSHIPHGNYLTWDPAKVHLVPSAVKPEGEPLNLNVLLALEKSPFLIPQEWLGKRVFFKGTILTKGGKNEYVVSIDVRYYGSGVRASVCISANVPDPCADPTHFDAILVQ